MFPSVYVCFHATMAKLRSSHLDCKALKICCPFADKVCHPLCWAVKFLQQTVRAGVRAGAGSPVDLQLSPRGPTLRRAEGFPERAAKHSMWKRKRKLREEM